MAHTFSYGIPPHAKRVFKGVLFEVWQWEQEIFDGTKRTFEVVKRSDYAGVVPILENGKMVVLEQRQPNSIIFFSFPGGRVDEGETPLEAARRELREEAGIEAGEYMLWKRYQPHAKYVFEVNIFIARKCRTVGIPTMPEEESIVVHEFDFDELIELVDREDLFRGDAMRIDFLRAKYDRNERDILRKLFYG